MKITVNSKRKSRRSRGKRRRAAAAALTVIICTAAVFWFVLRMPAPKPAGGHAAAVALEAPATPAPKPLDGLQRRRVASALDVTFASTYGSGSYSIAVMDASGALVYGRHERTAVAPASTQKLIVASAALELLGPNYRFETLISAPNAPSADGTLDGNLYLVASGDPSLHSKDIEAGIAQLRASGLRQITGSALVDVSAMHGPEINPHWDPDDNGESYQAATSAISLDGNTAEFDFTGGDRDGDPASVEVVPRGAPVTLDGSVTTGDSDDADVSAEGTPNAFRLSGAVPAGQHRKAWLPVHGLPHYAALVFDAALKGNGIAVAGAPGVAAAPLESISLWSHESQPLRAIVHHMLYWSDNHYAEQLLRTLGRERGSGGDDASGLSVELQVLRARGIDVGSLHLFDGSGLSATNRVPALVLARLLSDAQLRGGQRSLYDILPAGGKEGTLKYYRFNDASGRVRAKSGHLSGVEGLAGYVDTRSCGRLAFAFLINHAAGDPDSEMVAALDRLAAL